jgi:hypothetical protein
MSTLNYDGFEFKILHTLEVNARAQYSEDGQDYRDTEFTFDIVGVLNPQATSYTATGALSPGQTPFTTHIGMRHALMQPRRPLTYGLESGQIVSVQTQNDVDGRPFLSDNRGGPYPQAFDIIEVQGLQSIVARFRIKTYINECSTTSTAYGQTGLARHLVLNNRYRRYVSVDQDQSSVFVTEGTVVFRMDELIKRTIAPDQFRQYFGFAIPPSFQRKDIFIQPTQDGTGVYYRFTDKQMAYQIGKDSPATRMEIIETDAFATNMAYALIQTGKAALPQGGGNGGGNGAGIGGVIGGIVGTMIFPAIGTLGGVWAGGMIGHAFGSGSVASAFGALTAPMGVNKATRAIVAKAWGNPNQPRNVLTFACIAACFGIGFEKSLAAATQWVITQSRTTNYVEAQVTFVQDSIVNAAPGMANILRQTLTDNSRVTCNIDDLKLWISPVDPFSEIRKYIDQIMQNYPASLKNGATITIVDPSPSFGSPQSPYAQGNMGTYPAILVAASLLAPCAAPKLKNQLSDLAFPLGGFDQPV